MVSSGGVKREAVSTARISDVVDGSDVEKATVVSVDPGISVSSASIGIRTMGDLRERVVSMDGEL